MTSISLSVSLLLLLEANVLNNCRNSSAVLGFEKSIPGIILGAACSLVEATVEVLIELGDSSPSSSSFKGIFSSNS